MLGKDISVEAFCHHCAEPIEFSLKDGKLTTSDPPEPVVFLSMPAAKWWDNIVNTCSNNMVFFSSKKHLDEWLGWNPGLSGQTLGVEKTVELSVPTYKDKMNIDFERPPKDELTRRWAMIGLTGDFWKL